MSAEEQLADCDVVKPEERALWRAQDAIVEAMPHALSDAFQKVEADFFEHTKVRLDTMTPLASGCRKCVSSYGSVGSEELSWTVRADVCPLTACRCQVPLQQWRP